MPRIQLSALMGFLAMFFGVNCVSAAPTQAELESSLKLHFSIEPRVLHPWDQFTITVTMENTSNDKSFEIVLPGEGSFEGIREPHAYFIVERLERDQWRQLSSRSTIFCGSFSRDWTKSTATLAPGESASMRYMQYLSGFAGEFSTPGKYRVSVVYSYRGDAPVIRRPDGQRVDDYGSMEGYPAHKLVSGPIEFDVPDGPLRAEIVISDDVAILDADTVLKPGSLTIRMVNISDREIEIDTQQGWRHYIHILATHEYTSRGRLMERRFGSSVLEVILPGNGVIFVPAHGAYEIPIAGVRHGFRSIDLAQLKELDNAKLVARIYYGPWNQPLESEPLRIAHPAQMEQAP